MLDEIDSDVAPFKVVPRSHLSFHEHGNPYLRYAEHPGQVKVKCRPGSAVMLNQNVVHGNFPNLGSRTRRLLAIAYRPDWAGPLTAVADWDASAVAKTPAAVQAVLRNRSMRIFNPFGGNKPGMPPMPDAAVFDTKDEMEVLEAAAVEWTARIMEGLPADSTFWRSTAAGLDPARWGEAESLRQVALQPAAELALLQAYDASADARVRTFGQWLRSSPRCAIRLPAVDWAALSFGQHLRQLEVEGFTVFPSTLHADVVARLKASIAELVDDHGVDYSKFQRAKNDIEFASPEITELIGYPPMIAFLRRLFGSTPVRPFPPMHSL